LNRKIVFYNSRQRSIDSYIDEDACYQGKVDVIAILNSVWDAVEARTCGECKHDYCGCSIQDSLLHFTPSADLDTFGCNKFKPKEQHE